MGLGRCSVKAIIFSYFVHETPKRGKGDLVLPILRPWLVTHKCPCRRAWAVVDLEKSSIPMDAQNQQVFRFARQRNLAALRCLDLNLTFTAVAIMALGR